MPARGRRGGGFPLWLGILLLIALGVILWLFLKGDVFTDDTPDGSTGTAGAEAPANATAGTNTVGGEDLLGLAGEGNDALVDREGQEVTADGVIVQGVLGDESFWVGTDLDHRVLVGLESDTSAVSIEAGDHVSFQGTVEPLPLDFVDRLRDSGRGGHRSPPGAGPLRAGRAGLTGVGAPARPARRRTGRLRRWTVRPIGS